MTIGENRRTLEGTQFFIGWGESGGGGEKDGHWTPLYLLITRTKDTEILWERVVKKEENVYIFY